MTAGVTTGPLELWLLTPVIGTRLKGSPEAHFNRAHRSTRSIVQRCIGILKNRFRCLQRNRVLNYDPPKLTANITACAILHNIYLSSKISEPDAKPEQDPWLLPNFTEDGDDSDNDNDLAGSVRNGGNVVRRCGTMCSLLLDTATSPESLLQIDASDIFYQVVDIFTLH